MSDLTIPAPNTLADVPTDQLRSQLASAIGITARSLAYMAVIWRELEKRGEDLSDLRGGLMLYIPLIAADKLDPELVVRCVGQTMLLKAMSTLPIRRQRELLANGVRVARVDAGELAGDAVTPLEELSAAQVRATFASSWVRTPDEQVPHLAPVAGRGARGATLTIHLTATEYAALRAGARAARRSVEDYMRERALRGSAP